MKQITEEGIIERQTGITLEELRIALNKFCEEYPQFKNKEVIIASECGTWSTDLTYPACFCITEPYNYIKILSNDDGQFRENTQFYQ